MNLSIKTKKTIILINLRFAEFYSSDLFKHLKLDSGIRLVAIVDQQFNERIGQHIAPYLDDVFVIKAKPKNGFLAEFSYSDLSSIVKNELNRSEEVRLVCSDEFNLLNTGKLRREFCLEGHDDTHLLLYRDKTLMKDVLQCRGIRVPRFVKIHARDTFEQIMKVIPLPFVIKPVDSCGSYGVFMIKSKDDYLEFKNKTQIDKSSWEAEEYIDGVLYHVDSLIREGEIEFICASEYTCPNHEYVKGSVLGSIPLPETNHHSIRLIHFAKKCLKILGANNMANHMELFINKRDEIVFLEVSARPPGGFLNLIHKINFDVNLVDEDFFMQSGEEVGLTTTTPVPGHAFFALFPLLPGKVVELKHPIVQSKYDLTWHVREGDTIQEEDCLSIVGKSAHAIFYNDDMNDLRADFERVKAHQAVTVG